jgi:transcriptional antiterminator RfaH
LHWEAGRVSGMVLNQREPPDRGAIDSRFTRWGVVHTFPHAERIASRHLDRQGFRIYLPRYLKRRRHARRMDIVAAPLFPRYVFVAIDKVAQRWQSIHSTVGIVRLVSIGDELATVPQAIIDGLRRREDINGFVQLEHRPRFAAGDAVRVLEGAFFDRCGLVEGMSGRERVAILLDILGRKVRVILNTEIIDAA